MTRAWPLLLLLPAAVFAAPREEARVVGWGRGCSVAVGVYDWGRLEGSQAQSPSAGRVGTLSLRAGQDGAKADWRLRWRNGTSSDWRNAFAVESQLKKEGYASSGFDEELATGPYAAGFSELLSSSALADLGLSRLPSGYRVATIDYPPGPEACVLAILKPYAPAGKVADSGRADGALKLLLTRTALPSLRTLRSRAHLKNAAALLQEGKIEPALRESAVAAAETPGDAQARYDHAAFLCLDGDIEGALAELGAAIAIDPSLRARAPQDMRLDILREDPRFSKMMAGKS